MGESFKSSRNQASVAHPPSPLDATGATHCNVFTCTLRIPCVPSAKNEATDQSPKPPQQIKNAIFPPSPTLFLTKQTHRPLPFVIRTSSLIQISDFRFRHSPRHRLPKRHRHLKLPIAQRPRSRHLTNMTHQMPILNINPANLSHRQRAAQQKRNPAERQVPGLDIMHLPRTHPIQDGQHRPSLNRLAIIPTPVPSIQKWHGSRRAEHDEVIPILDFGSQYAQLIARRVREKGVYSASWSGRTFPSKNCKS
jgi:hypothetical protein